MEKHAYLIMAHNNFDLLQKELYLLDDERNDIFIHIDKKAKNVDQAYITEKVKKAKVYFIPRRSIKWAAYSGIQCEIDLLKAAVEKGTHAYYHLLSGADLPLQSQDEIYAFFEEHKGKEFVSFDRPVPREQDMKRIRKYYFFQDIYGRNRRNPFCILLFGMDKVLGKFQDILKTDRYRKVENFHIQKGPNWFSITQDLACTVIEKERWIRKYFRYTRSGDEVFLQTLVNSSKYKRQLYQNGYTKQTNACLRKIDWGRGKPYTWQLQDYEELVHSGCLFARKFDPKVDAEIIEKIVRDVRP